MGTLPKGSDASVKDRLNRIDASILPTSPVQGDIVYYNGSAWVRLGYGVSGYFLKTQGASANPIWAASTGGANVTRATFTNGTLAGGVLTITHGLALSAPYSVIVVIFNNNNLQIIPDNVTGATNTVAVDLTSYGTLTGTWGYAIVAG